MNAGIIGEIVPVQVQRMAAVKDDAITFALLHLEEIKIGPGLVVNSPLIKRASRITHHVEAEFEGAIDARALRDCLIAEQAIRGLEESLGVRLLSRTTRNVSPTEAGQDLLALVWSADTNS